VEFEVGFAVGWARASCRWLDPVPFRSLSSKEVSPVKISKILVPIDFSTHSVEALEFALELARPFDAEIHLLHVFPEALITPPPYGPALPTDYRVEIEKAAKEHFVEWQDEHCPEDVKLVAHMRRGDPARQVVGLAEELAADLVVMGTRGLTGVQHLLLGSVAEHVVRHSPCTVVTTKSRPDSPGS